MFDRIATKFFPWNIKFSNNIIRVDNLKTTICKRKNKVACFNLVCFTNLVKIQPILFHTSPINKIRISDHKII